MTYFENRNYLLKIIEDGQKELSLKIISSTQEEIRWSIDAWLIEFKDLCSEVYEEISKLDKNKQNDF